jgi:predicted DNA repair protein MutK
MPGTSLLALLDDIATVLDDVAVLTKVAGKKTAGVLGDDLALNAEQVAGVRSEREIPVVWAVAKGSARNKAILVPSALAISAFAPALITPLLMLGGAYLCFEGFEKIAHRFLHPPSEVASEKQALLHAVSDPEVDLVEFEKEKIQGAIRTDFVLSAEIIAITLGAAAEAHLVIQAAVLVAMSIVMTVGVYGFVAGIVKLDDLGLYLSRRKGAARLLGGFVLRAAPWLMKLLSVAGTAAMFLVGGGILAHGLARFEHLVSQLAKDLASMAGGLGGLLGAVVPALANGLLGIFAGLICFVLLKVALRIRRSLSA